MRDFVMAWQDDPGKAAALLAAWREHEKKLWDQRVVLIASLIVAGMFLGTIGALWWRFIMQPLLGW